VTACSLWCDAVAYGVGIDDNSALVGVYLTLFIVSLPVVSLTKSKGGKRVFPPLMCPEWGLIPFIFIPGISNTS